MVVAACVALAGLLTFILSNEHDETSERIGVRLRRSNANLPRARIRGMTTSIDSEDSDLSAPDSDIR